MDDRLLIHMFEVDFGECILLSIPDGDKTVKVLIDCGSRGEQKAIGRILPELEKMITNQKGEKYLDLLVVTHPHDDHFNGFTNPFFLDVKIGNIWMSPGFNMRKDPNLKIFYEYQKAIKRGISKINTKGASDLELKIIAQLSEFVKNAEDTVKKLKSLLVEGGKIEYVNTGSGLPKVKLFTSDDIVFKVLSPVEKMDDYYLGGKGLPNLQTNLKNLSATESYARLFTSPKVAEVRLPANISVQDFESIKKRDYANVLAAAQLAGSIVNNLSVVLLLEWHGKRLLFPGDAEFRKEFSGEVKEKTCNGSWNVMWKHQGALLSKPVDFLKVGHHGSRTATPWDAEKPGNPMNALLKMILPDDNPTAYAGVSTKKGTYAGVPDDDVMKMLCQRICSDSLSEYTEPSMENNEVVHQPKRTDLAIEIHGDNLYVLPYISFSFS